MTTPTFVREALVDALRLDLIGPKFEDTQYAEEILPQAPSRWYLTGFLVPYEASISQRSDETVTDEMDQVSRPEGGDDENAPEVVAARKAFFPSSLGLSVLLGAAVQVLTVTVSWGDYTPLGNPKESPSKAEAIEGGEEDLASGTWQRKPHCEILTITLPKPGAAPRYSPIPNSGGLDIVVSVRAVNNNALAPEGTRSVSIFLVNRRVLTGESERDIAVVFQAALKVEAREGFVPRPNPRGMEGEDWDEAVADLQYRDDFEFAVGHNISAQIHLDPDGQCRKVCTTWMPTAEVERVMPSKVSGVELSMEQLAAATSGEALQTLVGGLVNAYNNWIASQPSQFPGEQNRQDTAQELLVRARRASARIQAGLQLLVEDAQAFEAFCIANRVIARAIRQRLSHGTDKTPDSFNPPQWRPFQLAFILMNLEGIARPDHADRETVDLLFFPTGGGKTEAYLGLAAFTLVLRRLRHPGITSAGLSVLMRYTLRLLTLDQLGRAATLICALELERQQDIVKLGTWPFEIGLWVGQSATPNRMGRKGDNDRYSARARTMAYQNGTTKNSPVPLENCPWCGIRFSIHSFQLLPNADDPQQLRITCTSRRCVFRGDNALPILAVDDSIYRRLPCFIIATVDKFANLPWVGETGTLFGKVNRFDKAGFYGPAEHSARGGILEGPLPPPDFIIQDELHLISGPLGTMVGLYETAIDALSMQEIDGKRIRPKIIASTATVRRATRQIRALFCRDQVDIFPVPGSDRRDSFFAQTVSIADKPGRLYVGIAAQGRSLKVVMLRAYLALLGAAQRQWLLAGGAKNTSNPADPYMTLLGYFNALRELGGSRRIVEDEVNARLARLGERRRVGEKQGLFANRKIADEPAELTSRISTNDVADTKRRLGLSHQDKDHIDVALATNMISVGLDITRLGLMVVLGQPKGAAEYIQATSRVGRDQDRPGLVVTLLNIHRPRDRSHYERFTAWHNNFYRSVEATSVTPFSPRAVDRGLAAVTVALARLGLPSMTYASHAFDITEHRKELAFVSETIAQRAEEHDKDLDATEAEALRQKIRARVESLLDTWQYLATAQGRNKLQYQREVGEAPPLLYDPLSSDLERQPLAAHKFKAGRSLRDVEPTVNLWIRDPNGHEVDTEEES